MTSTEKAITIPGPIGSLEGLWRKHNEANNTENNIAIVCHPLPTHGGNMHNKVVHMLAQVFTRLGIDVLRFNTRGTGCSEGVFDNGIGEIDDLTAVAKFAQQTLAANRLWLAGFSFGSYIAYQFTCMTSVPIAHLVMVAPPVERYTYSFDTPPHCPVTMLAGDCDEIVTPRAMTDWSQQAQQKLSSFSLLPFADTTHFFHGKLIELRTRLEENLQHSHRDLPKSRAIT